MHFPLESELTLGGLPSAIRTPDRAVRLPNFGAIRDHFVVYLDVLGIGPKLRSAKSPADLESIYQVLRRVQQVLDHPSHAVNKKEIGRRNREVGKRTVALSDAIVMAVDPVSSDAASFGPYDVVCMEMENLVWAQAKLAEEGIFVRGGIAYGKFLLHSDILVSPALVEAYRLESKVALYPRILIHADTLKRLLSLPGAYAYGGEHPFLGSVLAATDAPEHFMLDYLQVLGNARDSDWVEPRLFHEYQTTRDSKRKQRLLNLSAVKAMAYTLQTHRAAVRSAAARATGARVLEKYLWLMRYHNEVCRRMGGFPRQRFRAQELRGIQWRKKREV
ncbi:MAG TPA: hypothetical protein VG936_11030 [Lacunisphaera sp.]|nr:hypothetical protein [Lacunisphaera sp.]